ncbi:MAG: CoA-binding protein [Candidatus Thermofonsia Clade 1 bacterium]|uniref:CoA-binding protein n=1 Tax=Candidatus Thermofonsia Clade 1 bacterium TaxID=2364210 RepID=A0A2M8P3H7_9CHLR|nr:MAG: CoA-binding protein [Candidatus Thermofonsia Clade 1 bacterium]
MRLTTDEEIRQLLQESQHVAVVGWSPKPDRPSHDVAAYLKAHGYTIYPINPTAQSTPEQPVFANLSDVQVPIDVVDVFRRAEDVPEVVEAAIAAGAKAIWIQLGIVNEEAAQRASEAGLKVVMDRCMKIELERLLPQGKA